MEPGAPTSIRPPLYPAFVAAVWYVAGDRNLQAVRAVQLVLALASAALVFAIGRRVYGVSTGRVAAAICWLYPSMIYSNTLILTETLFTFLLLGVVLAAVMLVESLRARTAFLCGLLLGLAALTRSVLWPAPLVLCPLIVLLRREQWRQAATISVVLFAGYVAAVGPWAVRNTRLQGVFTVVDTMGGLNLRMGNYEYTPEDRMWDAVSLQGEKSWVYAFTQEQHDDVRITEGYKDKWAQRQAVEYMLAHPGTTLRRSLIKFADFWGLEREFIAGVRDGFYSPPRWFQIVATLAMVGGYVCLMLAAVSGLWLAAPSDWRQQVLVLFPIVLITGIHSVVFGHSRYHLPLAPILGIYGAALIASRVELPRPRSRTWQFGWLASCALLCVIWLRQLLFVDANKIRQMLHLAGL
jgi:4-amino-4-deoxy-L-arabinose transferase-like glycosyltransferase